mmetsp:Transcript_12701/g.14559  ORF Transcript_12701/g.14559 Transcript_12701/m.14559 type:complete len:261 (+) Transcript_12701:143-925(+)
MDNSNQEDDKDKEDVIGDEQTSESGVPATIMNDKTESENNVDPVSMSGHAAVVAASAPSSQQEISNGAANSTAIAPITTSQSESTRQNALPPAASASPSTNRIKKSGQSQIPFVDDPNKITLKFVFANRDGLHVIIDVQPDDTVGEAKGALLSMWPDEIKACSGGDHIRLICMGKGILMPDSRTMRDCAVPVFKTHATPINVSVKPENVVGGSKGYDNKKSFSPTGSSSDNRRQNRRGQGTGSGGQNGDTVDQCCACVIS